MNAHLHWREDATVELVAGYRFTLAGGVSTSRLTGVRFAVEGGFVHVAVPGRAGIQVVSAPAVRRIDYPVPAAPPAD